MEKIYVVSHRPYDIPRDSLYQPLQVGPGEPIPGWLRDNTGMQISEKNSTFCELTALYWIWKNTGDDAAGLCHYRRYLASPADRRRRIATADVRFLLGKADVILPSRRHYWIETRESHYAHAHHIEDLRVTEEVLQERYPEYLPAWRKMLRSRSGHICNMFIMPRPLLDRYCAWLFDILFEVEKRLDISAYSAQDRRVFGFLGERLLDVWISQSGVTFSEVPMLVLENPHWVKKGFRFLQRKWQGHP